MMDASLILPTGEVVVFDLADSPLVKQYRWYRCRFRHSTYATTRIGRRTVYMHRLIMGEPEAQVDHRDGAGLNNRRENLRRATIPEQRRNRRAGEKRAPIHSRFKGVAWSPRRQAWYAKLTIHGDQHTRQAHNEEDAALLYNMLALRHFGEFARLNECA